MRLYIEEVKAMGFTVDAMENDQEVQGTVIYAYSAENADGYSLGVMSAAAGQFTLSVTEP